MPTIRSYNVLEVWRGVKALLRLEVGLTRAQLPASPDGQGPALLDARRQLNQLTERNRRLETENRQLTETQARYPEPPAYHHDGLAVWNKNVSFLEEPAFVAAYDAGMNSGHKIGRQAGTDTDIHIEWRVHVVCWAAWHASRLPGTFVECGVNTGIFSLAACHYIDFNATGKDFFLFDTFTGIPEEQMLEAEKEEQTRANEARYEDCYDVARRNFEPFPRAHLIRGKVPDTLESVDVDKVCYLSIDMNIVAPEVAAFEHFWPKLVPGALVLLDDYGFIKHSLQKEAMDKLAAAKGVKILTLPTGQGLLVAPDRR